MKKYQLFRNVLIVIFAVFSISVNAQNVAQQKINITNFHVVQNQNKISINWTAGSDVATSYFEVEKSNDGKNFKTVAYVLGADPSKTDCDCFGCFDKITTNTKESYYRLKHVDTNGIVQFSEVKMLALK